MHAQLANLMQEFVQSSDVPPETEARLRSFLSSKASMCVPVAPTRFACRSNHADMVHAVMVWVSLLW